MRFVCSLRRFVTDLSSSYQRLQESRRHAQSAKSSSHRLDKEVQATLSEAMGDAVTTETVVSMGTVAEEAEELAVLRERLNQSEKNRAELQEMLSSKE